MLQQSTEINRNHFKYILIMWAGHALNFKHSPAVYDFMVRVSSFKDTIHSTYIWQQHHKTHRILLLMVLLCRLKIISGLHLVSLWYPPSRTVCFPTVSTQRPSSLNYQPLRWTRAQVYLVNSQMKATRTSKLNISRTYCSRTAAQSGFLGLWRFCRNYWIYMPKKCKSLFCHTITSVNVWSFLNTAGTVTEALCFDPQRL